MLKIVFLIVTLAFNQIPGIDTSIEKMAPISIKQAVPLVGKPASGFGNMSPFELQVHYRLMCLEYRAKYKYDKTHDAAWKKCMSDEKQNLYARLCAAYYLLDHHKEAREFVKKQLKSKNLRHRYNAAEILRFYIDEKAERKWAIDVLIGLLADGSIDGSGVTMLIGGWLPDGDRDDIIFTPIDNICLRIGFMKLRKSVPTLISVLQRKPKCYGAAAALGDIGDPRAIPILLKVYKEKTGDERSVVPALGQLKSKAAVPILIERLANIKYVVNTSFESRVEDLLDALLAIGDKRAVPVIEKFLKGKYPNEQKKVARRILAQMNSKDPVKDLLLLLKAETNKYERGELIRTLAKYKEDRVVRKFAEIARTSDLAYLRRKAIYGLSTLGTRQALLVLASLLDLKYPKELLDQRAWKRNYHNYFPQAIVGCLKDCTKQDFGKDRAKWEAWIIKHVK